MFEIPATELISVCFSQHLNEVYSFTHSEVIKLWQYIYAIIPCWICVSSFIQKWLFLQIEFNNSMFFPETKKNIDEQ